MKRGKTLSKRRLRVIELRLPERERRRCPHCMASKRVGGVGLVRQVTKRDALDFRDGQFVIVRYRQVQYRCRNKDCQRYFSPVPAELAREKSKYLRGFRAMAVRLVTVGNPRGELPGVSNSKKSVRRASQILENECGRRIAFTTIAGWQREATQSRSSGT